MTTRSDTGTPPLPEMVAAHVHASGDRVSIVLVGDIDGYSGAPILDIIDGAVPCGVALVELDMSRVGFLDLGGLRMLLGAHRLSAQRGARLILRHPAAHLRWLLDLTGTAALLLDDTVSSAPQRPDDGGGDPPRRPLPGSGLTP